MLLLYLSNYLSALAQDEEISVLLPGIREKD